MGTNIIILLALALAIAIPVLIYKIKAKLKKKKKFEALRSFAQNAGHQITESESIENIYFGIDKQAKMCFYINFSRKNEIMVDLKSIKLCKVNEVSRSEQTNKGRTKTIDSVELLFYPKDSKESTANMEFFNAENGSFQLGEELLFVRRWEGIMNRIISDK